ncbi:MAG: response regulator [Bdellovibrionales bacterium]|nr:response regulator [Bdellovibrionales bacterium]
MEINSQYKLLIVDDVAENVELLVESLEPCNYNIFQCSSGEECLELAAKISPHIILLDVSMKGIDGFETCRRLKKNKETSHIPIIFISGRTDGADLTEGFSSGGADFVNKPFVIEEVILRLNRQLEIQNLFQANINLIDKLERQNQQLIQSEKMASVGQLVAGVAHEINNPTNFVSNNLEGIERENKKLLEILEEIVPRGNSESDRFYGVIDPRFITIQEMIDGATEGTGRISRIVKSLSDFSRHEEELPSKTNINEIIKSTVQILKFNLDSVDFSMQLSEAHEFLGFPAKLSQVIMNLLTNAIYAAKEKTTETPKVQIKSYENAENIFVEIYDNGNGISKELRAKVFDPFFTTKPTGVGTGLGLSISYSIIHDQHGGDLSFVSDSQGTVFTIRIPRNKNI